MKGKKLHGLIVDPGAASGLMGVDTLQEYFDDVLWPLGFGEGDLLYTYNHLPWLRGIEGYRERAVARVSLLVGVDGELCLWDADLSRGGCPGLLSNESFRRLRLSLIANFFENGDGILASCLDGKTPN